MIKPSKPRTERDEAELDPYQRPTTKRDVPASLRDPLVTTKIPKDEIDALLEKDRESEQRQISGTQRAVTEEEVAERVRARLRAAKE